MPGMPQVRSPYIGLSFGIDAETAGLWGVSMFRKGQASRGNNLGET